MAKPIQKLKKINKNVSLNFVAFVCLTRWGKFFCRKNVAFNNLASAFLFK